jgi:hypothetical protein
MTPTATKIRPFKVHPRWLLKLRPYEVQNIAFGKARDHDKFGHWLEQGIGKTLVAFAEFYDHLERELVDCMIVILPSYLLSNWETEAEQYGIEYPVITWPDVPSDRQMQQPFTLAINTEAVLKGRRGGEYIRGLIKAKRGRVMLVVDESVCIGNHSSQVSKQVIEIGYLTRYHRALSGLPTPETPEQWWSQLRFCGQLNGVMPKQFRNRYCVLGGYMGKKVMPELRDDNRAELEAIIDSCSIRALKEDWLDLPPKIWHPPIEFEMEGEQLAAFKTMLNEFYVEIMARDDVMAEQVIHQLQKLQQIARGFILDAGEVATEFVDRKKNPALRVLKQQLETIRGKSLIFTFHAHSTRVVWEELNDMGYECVALRGGLTKEEIRERKEAFNRDPKVRGLVGQSTVTKRGHTLLGQTGSDRCSTSIFYENTYSRDTRSQLEDRNHRHGQDAEHVSYIDICEKVKGSPTRKALIALAKKQDFIETTINAMRTRNA